MFGELLFSVGAKVEGKNTLFVVSEIALAAVQTPNTNIVYAYNLASLYISHNILVRSPGIRSVKSYKS